MKINLLTIPHNKQRYDTCGDYWQDDMDKDQVEFRISNTGDEKSNFLIAIHEIIEAYLTKFAGIKWEDIDNFDKEYEKKRKKGDSSEPGFDVRSPYRNQHTLATLIERRLCREVGLDWDEYEKLVNSL